MGHGDPAFSVLGVRNKKRVFVVGQESIALSDSGTFLILRAFVGRMDRAYL